MLSAALGMPGYSKPYCVHGIINTDAVDNNLLIEVIRWALIHAFIIAYTQNQMRTENELTVLSFRA
jgi:hypothetical protein